MRMLKKQPKFKIISLLLLISILIQIVMPLTTLAAGLTVKLSSSATEIKAGDTISVETKFGNKDVVLTKISLTFDGGLSGSFEGIGD